MRRTYTCTYNCVCFNHIYFLSFTFALWDHLNLHTCVAPFHLALEVSLLFEPVQNQNLSFSTKPEFVL